MSEDCAIKTENGFSYILKYNQAIIIKYDENMLAENGILSIPASLSENTVSMIADYAFKGCLKIKEIIINKGIKYIGAYAFLACIKLEKIYIPETIECIGCSAFKDCINLKECTFKNKEADILDDAFKNTKIESADPSMYTKFQFNNNMYLNLGFNQSEILKIENESEVLTIDDKYSAQNDKEYKIISTAPYCCADMKNLKKIIINTPICIINDFSFSYNSLLEEISLPSSVKVIGSYAFEGDYSLKKIVINSEDLVSVSQYAFADTADNIEICVRNEEMYNKLIESISDKYNVTLEKEKNKEETPKVLEQEHGYNNNIDIFKYYEYEEGLMITGIDDEKLCENEKVIIPDTIQGKIVIAIGIGAFKECTKIAEVKIPETVRRIREKAFYGCSKLKKIEGGSGIRILEEYCFGECINLEDTKYLNNLMYIGMSAFFGCISIKKFTLSKIAERVETSAFRNCKSLNEVTIDNDNTIIAKGAFYGTPYMKNNFAFEERFIDGDYEFVKTIRDQVEIKGFSESAKIGKELVVDINETVHDGRKLRIVGIGGLSPLPNVKIIKIESSITLLKSYQFYGNKNMENVYLPKELKIIGAAVFQDCISLKNVFINSEEIYYINSKAFENISDKVLFFVKNAQIKDKLLESGIGENNVFLGEEDYKRFIQEKRRIQQQKKEEAKRKLEKQKEAERLKLEKEEQERKKKEAERLLKEKLEREKAKQKELEEKAKREQELKIKQEIEKKKKIEEEKIQKEKQEAAISKLKAKKAAQEEVYNKILEERKKKEAENQKIKYDPKTEKILKEISLIKQHKKSYCFIMQDDYDKAMAIVSNKQKTPPVNHIKEKTITSPNKVIKEKEIDKTQLNIIKIEVLKEKKSDYTDESWQVLSDIMIMPERNQDEINKKISKLKAAYKNLIKIGK